MTALRSAAWSCGVVVAAVTGYLALASVVLVLVDDAVVASTVVAVVSALGAGLARVHRPSWFDHEPAPRPPASRLGLWALVAGAAVMVFVAGQSAALLLYEEVGSAGFDQYVSARRATQSIWLVLVSSVVLAPLGEEALLRGVVYPLLRRRTGVLLAMLLSSAVFAVLHGNVVQLVATVPLGCLLAMVVEQTRRLWPAVCLHAAYNLAALLVPARAVGQLATPAAVVALVLAMLAVLVAVASRVMAAGAVRPAAGTGAV